MGRPSGRRINRYPRFKNLGHPSHTLWREDGIVHTGILVDAIRHTVAVVLRILCKVVPWADIAAEPKKRIGYIYVDDRKSLKAIIASGLITA